MKLKLFLENVIQYNMNNNNIYLMLTFDILQFNFLLKTIIG